MRFTLVGCEVFAREIYAAAAVSPHLVDVELTPKGAHDKAERLRELIAGKIAAADRADQPRDAVLLAFGLCGNACAGLAAGRTRLVIPRAHDCCTIFLGSKARFKELFGDNPSRGFSSTGYAERGDSYVRDPGMERMMGLDRTYEEYVEKYGEENAKYIMDALDPGRGRYPDDTVVFIETPATRRLGYAEKCRAQAEAEGKKFILVEGDPRLINALADGAWNPDEFLVVEPGSAISPVYDWDEIVRAVPRNAAGAELPGTRG